MEHSLSWEANSHSDSQEIPRLLWNPKSITVFTRVRYWSLFWARWVQSTASHLIYQRSVLILSSHLRLYFHKTKSKKYGIILLPWVRFERPKTQSVLVTDTYKLCSSFRMWDQDVHPYKTKTIVLFGFNVVHVFNLFPSVFVPSLKVDFTWCLIQICPYLFVSRLL
jgi:hypothetical protein